MQASNFGGTFDQLFLWIFLWNFHRRCLSTSSIPWCKKVKNDQKLNQGGGGSCLNFVHIQFVQVLFASPRTKWTTERNNMGQLRPDLNGEWEQYLQVKTWTKPTSNRASSHLPDQDVSKSGACLPSALQNHRQTCLGQERRTIGPEKKIEKRKLGPWLMTLQKFSVVDTATKVFHSSKLMNALTSNPLSGLQRPVKFNEIHLAQISPCMCVRARARACVCVCVCVYVCVNLCLGPLDTVSSFIQSKKFARFTLSTTVHAHPPLFFSQKLQHSHYQENTLRCTHQIWLFLELREMSDTVSVRRPGQNSAEHLDHQTEAIALVSTWTCMGEDQRKRQDSKSLQVLAR